MARTDVNIVNIALSRLGITDTITSLSDTSSVPAIQANLIYAETRDNLLMEHPWRFATKHVLLNETYYDYEQNEYQYQYAYPANCLRVLRIYNDPMPTQPKHEYEVYSVGSDPDDSVMLIGTDVPNASADYIAQITDPAFFPPMFADCLAWRLAMELAVPLTRGFDKKGDLFKSYLLALQTAEAANVTEGHKRFKARRNKYIGAR